MYRIYEKIKLLHSSWYLSTEQRHFVEKLLYGHTEKNGWRAFSQILKNPKMPIRLIRPKNQPKNEIDNIISVLELEITNTSWLNIFYRWALLNIRRDLAQTRGLQYPSQNCVSQPQNERHDRLVAATIKSFHGELLLPVMQRFEQRNGTRGYCGGYALAWSKAILEDKLFGGISPTQEVSCFPYVPLTSIAGRCLPELNHLMPLDSKIAQFQMLYSKKNELKKAMKSEETDVGISIKNFTHFPKFFRSVDHLTDDLVEKINQNSEQVILASFWGVRKGHGIALCKKKNQYHVFDSNIGWIRFNRVMDFKAWFPVYFVAMGYAFSYCEVFIKKLSIDRSRQDEWLSLISFLLRPFNMLIHFFYKHIVRPVLYFFIKRDIRTVLKSEAALPSIADALKILEEKRCDFNLRTEKNKKLLRVSTLPHDQRSKLSEQRKQKPECSEKQLSLHSLWALKKRDFIKDTRMASHVGFVSPHLGCQELIANLVYG